LLLLGFVAWNTVQAISSYVRGVLSSHAVFRGVGVGSQVRSSTIALTCQHHARLDTCTAVLVLAQAPNSTYTCQAGKLKGEVDQR
jgi:hypothetical protein